MPETPRVALLPGTSSPKAESYRDVYRTIQNEAKERGYHLKMPLYPGQKGQNSGQLSFEGALQEAKNMCDELHPNFVIARSFGCFVATELLSSSKEWVDGCSRAVLWGPVLRNTLQKKLYPTSESRKDAIKKYRKEYDTHLRNSFFETIPSLANKVPKVRCNLKIARGSRDSYNSSGDVNFLADIHKRAQNTYLTQVVEVGGLEHAVTPKQVHKSLLEKYLDIMFEPVVVY